MESFDASDRGCSAGEIVLFDEEFARLGVVLRLLGEVKFSVPFCTTLKEF
jgi:hypothetical protein